MMTLEDLIKIVVLEIDKYFYKNNLKVVGILFEDKNIDLLKTNMSYINDNGQIFNKNNIEEINFSTDIVFLDYIPIEYVPKIALGIVDDNFTKFISTCLFNGTKIYVLKKGNYITTNATFSYKTLFKNYYGMIASYGFTLLDNNTMKTFSLNKNEINEIKTENKVYGKKFLTRLDLINNVIDNKIAISKDVIITDYALEYANNLKIEIIKT